MTGLAKGTMEKRALVRVEKGEKEGSVETDLWLER